MLFAAASIVWIKAQVTREAGFKAAMNPYSQPNIHILEGRKALDYYGSGDVNNDGIITPADAHLIRARDDAGNYRADVNGNAVIDSSDAEIIEEYLDGEREYLPSAWNNLKREEKVAWATKMLAIDKTDERPYVPLEFQCVEFALEHQINFFGIENFSGYPDKDRYDVHGNDNSLFNIPIYSASTVITPGEGSELQTDPSGHRIIAFLAGNDPLKFTDWHFVEPQDDSEVNPGDFSMNGDENAMIKWFGYSRANDSFYSRVIVAFDLEGGKAEVVGSMAQLASTSTSRSRSSGQRPMHTHACARRATKEARSKRRLTRYCASAR